MVGTAWNKEDTPYMINLCNPARNTREIDDVMLAVVVGTEQHKACRGR